MKKCSECVWSIHRDYGYSNYTVEGTNLYCGHMLNKDMPFDRWYGEDKRDLFAEECAQFLSGTSVYIDCDGDRIRDSNNPEERYSEYLNGYVSGAMIEAAT